MRCSPIRPSNPITLCGQPEDQLNRQMVEWILLGHILTACTSAPPPNAIANDRDRAFVSIRKRVLRFSRVMNTHIFVAHSRLYKILEYMFSQQRACRSAFRNHGSTTQGQIGALLILGVYFRTIALVFSNVLPKLPGNQRSVTARRYFLATRFSQGQACLPRASIR